MPWIAALILLIQIGFMVHALRTGRPIYWVFILLAAPLLGALVYYLVEIFPATRQRVGAERAVNKVMRGIEKSIDPKKKLRQRAADLEVCGSVDNRLALARECLAADMATEAVTVIQCCLSGPFATDVNLRWLLAQAQREARQFEQALSTVDDIQQAHPSFKSYDLALMRACLQEALGQTQSACASYAALIERASGEELRVRYGLLLQRLGQTQEAHALFQETLKNGQRLGAGYQRLHAQWIAQARAALKTNESRQ